MNLVEQSELFVKIFVISFVALTIYGFTTRDLRKEIQQPQNIVYIALILLAIGITLSAIDPMKPNVIEYEPSSVPDYAMRDDGVYWAEVELPEGDYYIDASETDYYMIVLKGNGLLYRGHMVDVDAIVFFESKYSWIEIINPDGDLHRTYRTGEVIDNQIHQRHVTTSLDPLGEYKVRIHVLHEDGTQVISETEFEIIEEVVREQKVWWKFW